MHYQGYDHTNGQWHKRGQVVESNVTTQPELSATPQHVVDYVIKKLDLQEDDIFYDLGCGDGRWVVSAARQGCLAVGIDNDLRQLDKATELIKFNKVGDRASLCQSDVIGYNLNGATVVVAYLYRDTLEKVLPNIPASVHTVVTINHAMKDSEKIRVDSVDVYIWRKEI